MKNPLTLFICSLPAIYYSCYNHLGKSFTEIGFSFLLKNDRRNSMKRIIALFAVFLMAIAFVRAAPKGAGLHRKLTQFRNVFC